MRVLLTGANGFIGRNVVERLAGQDLEFVTLDRAGLGLDITHDLTKELTWDPPKHVDAIIHLAAEGGVRTFDQDGFENNVQATANVLKWATATNVKIVVFASSSSVYGNQVHMEETASCVPLSPYAQSKFASERMVNSWTRSTNRVAVTFRLFNTIGLHQREGMFPSLVCKHLQQRKLGIEDELVLFGSRLRSWTYVGDIVNGFWSALQMFGDSKRGTRLTFNLGTNAMLTQRDLTKLFTDRVPVVPNIIQGEPNPLDVQRTKADMARFSATFGWLPDHRNVNVAVEELIRQYGLTG